MNSKKATFAIVFLVLFSLQTLAQDASSVNKGVTKLSVPATNSYDPIAAGDNDPRLNAYHNVAALGAIGDGTTDNSAALQQAINSGHAVMIPEGTFNFSNTLTLKKDSIIVGIIS